MNHLRVKNWDHFQHYKDRSPPWIKLHRELLRDYQFSCLQDASKLHLMLIWLLASQLDNRIPNDPAWIQRQLGVSEPVKLKPLIDSGFLVLVQDDSKPLATRQQLAELETEAETEAYKQEAEGEAETPCAPSDESLDADGESETPYLTLPLVDKTEYPIFQSQVDAWSDSFPGIDVGIELRKLREWNVATAKNRKTKTGVLRHVTAWLSRAQDRSRPTGNASAEDAREIARRRIFGEDSIPGQARRIS